MEDMRLVRFVDVDEIRSVYGNLHRVLTDPKFCRSDGISGPARSVEIKTVEIHALQGRYAKNKGLALFSLAASMAGI